MATKPDYKNEALKALLADVGAAPNQSFLDQQAAGMNAPVTAPVSAATAPPSSASSYTSSSYSGPGQQERQLTEDIIAQEEAMKQSVEQQQGLFEALKGVKADRNIAPMLAGFADMAGYDAGTQKSIVEGAKGMSGQDIRASLQTALGNVISGRDKSTDNQINLLKALESTRRNSAGDKEARQTKNLISSTFSKARNEVAKFGKESEEFQRQGAAIEEGLTDDGSGMISIGKVRSMIGNYARLVGAEKGVLTDPDIERQMVSTFRGKLQALRTKFTSNPEGSKVPVSEVAEMRELYNEALETYRELVANKLERSKNSYLIDPVVGAVPEFSGAIRNLFTGAQGFVPKKANFQKGSKPKTVTQGGVTYTLNQETGEYE
jgi:hypothetical protein